MPNEILLLIMLAVAVLAAIDVGLGHGRHGHFGIEGGLARISLGEFLTRPLPIFLFGLGAAMLPVRPVAGALLLAVAGGLSLGGRRARCARAGGCPEAS
jgi:hypothetical protein